MSKEVTTTQEKISDELDKKLLQALKKGVKVGVDDEGKPIHVDASAAVFNVARQRCRDLGLTKVVNPGDAADKLAKELFRGAPDNVLDLPAVSREQDSKAG